MKKSNYMNRALEHRDPRFAIILGELGYVPHDGEGTEAPATPTVVKQQHPLTELRKAYRLVSGKNPNRNWDAATLEAKITEAKEVN